MLPYVSPILKALMAKLRISPQLQITAATATTANKALLIQGLHSGPPFMNQTPQLEHARHAPGQVYVYEW